jgi:hypothetical protein
MNKKVTAVVLIAALLPASALAGRGGFGGGGGRGGFGGGRGGFDMHNDVPASRPQSFSHSSTGPQGTQRTTNVQQGANGGYGRETTATNGSASRTSYGGASANGNYTHGSTGSTQYGSHTSNTTGNVNTGNYQHTGSGSNQYGAYSTAGSGNTHNGTYNGSTVGVNSWGQVYTSHTSASGGVVYHGATVSNPVYASYGSWGWNGGYAWYPAPYYWGGGFWGPFAVGAATAVVFGTIAYENQTYHSYQVQPQSAGAKLLSAYNLTQAQCGASGLVVIFGPNNSVICAHPNNLVAAGNYSIDSSTLTLVSQKG